MLADLVHDTMAVEYGELAVSAARVHLVDLGHVLLGPYSDHAHDYAAKVLGRKGVRMHLGVAVNEVRPGEVVLGDGTKIPTRCVVWGGGIKAAGLAEATGLTQGRGGRLEVEHDLGIDGASGVYAAGDFANVPDPHGGSLPQLGSVALQSGQCVADNVLADFAGKPRKPFHYHAKGIMAMIGRGAAIAEVGAHRHELHGPIAFSAWLGVHASLMTGVRNRVDAFLAWGWDSFSSGRGPQVTTGALRDRAARAATRLSIPVLVAGAGLLAWIVAVGMDRNAKDVFPPVVPAALGAVALVAATVAVWRRASGRAFAMTAVATAALVATLFTSLYPRVLVSHPEFANSLTIDGAASQPYTLKVLTVAAVALVPAFALYQGWAYYVLRGRLGVPVPESAPRERSTA